LSTLYLRPGTGKRNYLQFGNRAPNRLPARAGYGAGAPPANNAASTGLSRRFSRETWKKICVRYDSMRGKWREWHPISGLDSVKNW